MYCRALHSEVYIRYIEGLAKESKSMCNWDRQLSTASEVSTGTYLAVFWIRIRIDVGHLGPYLHFENADPDPADQNQHKLSSFYLLLKKFFAKKKIK